MKKKIYIKALAVESLEEFLNREKIAIEIVSKPRSDVEVIGCTGRKESDLNTIYSTGWITCETARQLAKKLQISVIQMGKLLDYLDVKIRMCSLGCFK